MDLSKYEWPEVKKVDMIFPTFDCPKELIEEAEKRNLSKGRNKFNEMFYSGGTYVLQKDVKGTWKEKAFLWCRAMIGSWAPKHEHKEAVAAMIFEEVLILDGSDKRVFNRVKNFINEL